uniref:Putative ankyrin repeat protein L93 n=1 Tax=Magallana gigas TaxID=29159 RepID=K1PYF4_MAGGI
MSVNSAQSDPNYFPPVQITKILLHASADITEATLLPTAVQFGDLTLVKELIDLGMDINMLDDNMCTPLGSACSCVNVKTEVVKLLLDHGADVNRGGGWKKQKPIIFAYVHNSVNKIKLLLSFGATLTREEMTNLVSLSFSKSILENPEVITPWSKELMSWNLLLDAGFTPIDNDPVLANKIDQLRLCSSFDKINPWVWDMIFPMRSLKSLCRIVIRNSLRNFVKDVAIELLPLPTEIKRYLQLTEFSLPEKASSSTTIQYSRTGTGTADYFSSPGYPQPYASNLTLDLVLTATSRSAILYMDFLDCDLEFATAKVPYCQLDRITVHDGCCLNDVTTLQSSGPDLFLRFVSDSTVNGRGFYLKFYTNETATGRC